MPKKKDKRRLYVIVLTILIIIGAFFLAEKKNNAFVGKAAAPTCTNPLNGTINISVPKTTTTQGYTARLGVENDPALGEPAGIFGRASAGDMDNDGYDDFLMGDVRQDVDNLTNAGAAWLLYGPILENITLTTNKTGGIPTTLKKRSAMGPLFSSKSTAISIKTMIVFIGEQANGWAGGSIAGGDVNGDSCPDIFIGAYGYNSMDGKVYLLNGTISKRGSCTRFTSQNLSEASAMLEFTTGTSKTSKFGATTLLTDLNNDGYDDFIVGAPYYHNSSCTAGGCLKTGRVYLYIGPTLPSSPRTYSAVFNAAGSDNGDEVGNTISTGEFNSDGCVDLLIGGKYTYYNGTMTGIAYLLYQQRNNTGQCSAFVNGTTSTIWNLIDVGTSSLPGIQFYGEHNVSTAGEDLSFVGDVNADGYEDILIGSYAFDNTDLSSGEKAGAAYLVYGNNYSSSTGVPLSSIPSTWGAKFVGIEGMQKAGINMAKAGDVDGDGYDDFLVGTQSSSLGRKAFLIFGKASPWTGTYNLTNLTSDLVVFTGISKGGTVKGAGDINGDGYDDMLIGVDLENTTLLFSLINGGCR